MNVLAYMVKWVTMGGGSRNGSKIQKMGEIIYGEPLWLEVFVYHKPRNWEECSEQTRIGT